MPAYHLKDRNRPLPNGVSVYDSGTGFKAPAFASFSQQCQGVLQARLANPGLCKRYRLSTDMAEIENFVSGFLGKVAFDNNWEGYYYVADGGGGASAGDVLPPSSRSGRSASRVAAVVAGAKTIYEWVNSKEEAVPSELANKRAEICVACPLNEQGNLIDFFPVQAAQAIGRELERRRGWNLSTPSDDKLGVCQGCYCVNTLSVHCPIETKLRHMPKEVFDALHESCWVRTEKEKIA